MSARVGVAPWPGETSVKPISGAERVSAPLLAAGAGGVAACWWLPWALAQPLAKRAAAKAMGRKPARSRVGKGE